MNHIQTIAPFFLVYKNRKLTAGSGPTVKSSQAEVTKTKCHCYQNSPYPNPGTGEIQISF
jgi:hypothetical protein